MIDTLKISEDLAKLGFPVEQAKGMARIQAEAIIDGAATKPDIKEMELRLDVQLVRLDERTAITNRIGVSLIVAVVLQILGTFALYKKWI